MGMLSFRFKSFFEDLLKCLNSLHFYFILFSLINLSVAIYEDQIGKFDWQQSYVGRIKFAQFDTVSTAKKIIVATEENVLAALNLKTGQVVWRHVLESASSGNIQLLHVSESVLTVTGDNPYIVRGWDSNTGVLLWEWSLSLQDNEKADVSEWWVQNGMLVHLVPVFGSHLEVTKYVMVNGQNRGSTSRLPAVWNNEGCILTHSYYTCISGSKGSELLITMDVTSNAVQMISRPLSNYVDSKMYGSVLRPFDSPSIMPGFVIDDSKVIIIKNNDFEVMKFSVEEKSASVSAVEGANGPIILQTWQDNDNGFSLKARSVTTGEEVPDVKSTDKNVHIPSPEITAAMCTKTNREQFVCRILVNGYDDSVTLLQQGGRVVWTREESLANIVTVKFVDLPVSDLDAAIESEFDQKEGSIWSAFTRRITTQIQQLNNFIQSLKKHDYETEGGESSLLIRDYFNLHKVIVIVTDVGKIFGMDNLSGKLLWHRLLPELDTDGAVIYTRRSARHPPHDSYVTVVAKHQESGNGLIISLNPITGVLIGERVLHLDYKLLQNTMLPNSDAEHLRALVLLDEYENVQVFPQSSARLVRNMFMFVAEKNTAFVRGYALKYDGQVVNAIKTWTLNLGGVPNSGHSIISIVPKNPDEKVHSPGKVMTDRSVLYKYLNPNLVLFITEGPDPVHKDIVWVWCVDVVSGAVIFSQSHRRASATPHAVHSENFLAYIYYNDKHRRHEIGTVELFEGESRSRAAFSSLAAKREPRAQRLAYVLPAAPAALALSATQRGLTDKTLLLALSRGGVASLPWAWLEARATAGERGDGAEGPPPLAELPLPAELLLSYNRSLPRPARLRAAPAGLESTCLVLVTGLDIFYTRVAPSKTFDLLKDDFDYYLISIVLVALVVATYSTKYFASRKMLKQGWK